MAKPAQLLAGLLAVALLLTGCTKGSSSPSGSAPADGPDVLRVVASSEVADLQTTGILDELRKQTGVRIVLSEAGTLDASSRIASGEAGKSFDAAWLASNRYLSLLDGGPAQIATSTKLMASPVMLGVKPDIAASLGWTAEAPPTWSDVEHAVADGKLTYAMTNPAASNSGFSTLVAVATGLSGGGTALDHDRTVAVEPQLKQFFAGQRITAGSTGWITDKFVADSGCNALFSYEASLLQLNAAGKLAQPLVLLAPSDGVITADYPLSLLASAPAAKRDLYTKAVAWFQTPAAQQMIMDKTSRRPLAGGVKPGPAFGNRTLTDMPFPSSRTVVDELLQTYMDKARRPAATIYVLDVSGSMSGSRLQQLKQALGGLTSPTDTGFTNFHARETVTLLPFSSGVKSPQMFTIPEQNPQPTRDQIRAAVNGLNASGGTDLFEALEAAYGLVPGQLQSTPDAYVTVVLLTDGEANGRLRLQDFQRFYAGLPPERRVPTFTIRFGDAERRSMDDLAQATGGRSFDGTADLTEAFRTIRGYQ